MRCPILTTLRYRLGQKKSGGVTAMLRRTQQRVEHALLSTDTYLQGGQKYVVDANIKHYPRTRYMGLNFRELFSVNAHDEPPQRTWDMNSSWPCTLKVSPSARG